ncbi:MAG: hypothetical protein P8174_10550 [Gemmatimonadota bacterium]
MPWLTGITMALVFLPLQPVAQQACTYDACALAVSYQPFQLVQGEEREPLGRNLFGPHVQVLLDAGGETARWANSYRRYHTAQQVTGLGALVLGGAAYAIYHDDDQKLTVSLVSIGVVFGILEEAFQLKSLSRLNRAVWWFNRGLAGSSQ